MTGNRQHAGYLSAPESSFVEAEESYACPRCGHAFGSATGYPGALLSMAACPACHTPFLVPGRIGDFVLVERLTSDAMGNIYRARGRTLAKDVAVRIVPPSATASEVLRNRLALDVRKATMLNTPHLQKVYALSVVHNHQFLVLELLEGETLAQRIPQAARLPEIEVLHLALGVAEALVALHDVGLVHGTVTPENIVVGADGGVRLTCPGLLGSPRRDFTGGLLGTPLFIAPEVITGGADSPASDMYILGVTLYQLLTGHPPFAGATPDAIFKGHLYAVVLPVDVHAPGLSPLTRELVARLLKRVPTERFTNSRMLLAEIHRALAALDPAHVAPPAATDAALEASEESVPHAAAAVHHRLHLLILALISAIVIVIVAVSLAHGPLVAWTTPAPPVEQAPRAVRRPAVPPPAIVTVQAAHVEPEPPAVSACTHAATPNWQCDAIGGAAGRGMTLWRGHTATVTGEGQGIGGVEDGCRFLHAPASMPFVLTLRISRIATSHNTAKTGILIRGDNAPSAPCVFAGFSGNGDLVLQCRRQAGAETESHLFADGQPKMKLPCFLRMECSDNRVRASISRDGRTWEILGMCQPILAERAMVGFAVASALPGVMATAECGELRLLTETPEVPAKFASP
jgi:hypothetical protein